MRVYQLVAPIWCLAATVASSPPSDWVVNGPCSGSRMVSQFQPSRFARIIRCESGEVFMQTNDGIWRWVFKPEEVRYMPVNVLMRSWVKRMETEWEVPSERFLMIIGEQDYYLECTKDGEVFGGWARSFVLDPVSGSPDESWRSEMLENIRGIVLPRDTWSLMLPWTEISYSASCMSEGPPVRTLSSSCGSTNCVPSMTSRPAVIPRR